MAIAYIWGFPKFSAFFLCTLCILWPSIATIVPSFVPAQYYFSYFSHSQLLSHCAIIILRTTCQWHRLGSKCEIMRRSMSKCSIQSYPLYKPHLTISRTTYFRTALNFISKWRRSNQHQSSNRLYTGKSRFCSENLSNAFCLFVYKFQPQQIP